MQVPVAQLADRVTDSSTIASTSAISTETCCDQSDKALTIDAPAAAVLYGAQSISPTPGKFINYAEHFRITYLILLLNL